MLIAIIWSIAIIVSTAAFITWLRHGNIAPNNESLRAVPSPALTASRQPRKLEVEHALQRKAIAERTRGEVADLKERLLLKASQHQDQIDSIRAEAAELRIETQAEGS